MSQKNIELTLEEAKEIVESLAFSDSEGQSNIYLVKSICRKINVLYPEALLKYESFLTIDDKEQAMQAAVNDLAKILGEDIVFSIRDRDYEGKV